MVFELPAHHALIPLVGSALVSVVIVLAHMSPLP